MREDEHEGRGPSGPSASFARTVVRFRWPVLIGWVCAAAAAMTLLPDIESARTGSLGDLVATDATAIDTEVRSIELFEFPVLSRTVIVQHSADGFSSGAEARIYRRAVLLARGKLPGLEEIPFALPITNDPSHRLSSLETGQRPTTALTFLFFPVDVGPSEQTELAHEFVDQEINRPSDGRVGVTGAVPARAAQVDAITGALPLVELATVLLITLAVGFHYRSIAAPIGNIATVAITYLLSLHLIGGLGEAIGISVPQEVEPVMVALLFGIVTDYAIFFFSRFRAYLQEGTPSRAAAERTTADLLPTIVTAAITVAAASGVLVVAQLGFYRAFGPGTALSVLIALAVVTTFVPALLAVLGDRVLWPGGVRERHGRRPRLRRLAELRSRLLALPTSHPAATATLVALPLLALSVLVTRMELGNTLISGLPADSPPRRALVEARRGFEPGAVSPTMVLVEAPGITAAGAGLRNLQQALGERDHVAAVVGPAQLPNSTADLGAVSSPTGDAVRYLLILDVNPLGSRAVHFAERLDDDLPRMLAAAGLGDAEAALAGDTPLAAETVTATEDDLARIMPLAALAVFIVLAIFLRALVAPLYLVAASLLALGASLGLTVLVFQELLGHGEITFFVPFAGIVLLVALGSDYNVYLAGRVWAEARVLPLRRAVAVAGARASSAITIAGLILALSFSMLAIVPLQPFRELAFLLATGLLLDALVVRSLLAPALISLFGELSAWPGRRLGGGEGGAQRSGRSILAKLRGMFGRRGSGR